MNNYLTRLALALSLAFLMLSPVVWLAQYYGLPWLQTLQLEVPQTARIRILAIVVAVAVFFHLTWFSALSQKIRWLLVAVSLVAIELVCVKVYPVVEVVNVTQVDKQLGWTWIPGASREAQHDGEKFLLRFNSLGLRGEEVPASPDKLFLGNSITQAQHVPEEQTFVGLLNGVNAGFDGYNTMRERDRFQRDLYKLNAKKVLLIANAVDIMTEQANKNSIKETLANNQSITGTKTNLIQSVGSVLDSLSMKKLFVMAPLESQDRKDAYYTSIVMRKRDAHTWQEWTQALLDLKKAAAPNQFYVILSPPRSIVKMYQDGTRSFWANDNIKRFCQQNQIPFHDLLPSLAQSPAASIFVDPVHFNAEGHKIVASSIEAFLNSIN